MLGNLASRVISMIQKYRGGAIPNAPGVGLAGAIGDTLAEVRAAMTAYRVHEALGAAMDLARVANGYVEERQPWSQAKGGEDTAADLDETLATLAQGPGHAGGALPAGRARQNGRARSEARPRRSPDAGRGRER